MSGVGFAKEIDGNDNISQRSINTPKIGTYTEKQIQNTYGYVFYFARSSDKIGNTTITVMEVMP